MMVGRFSAELPHKAEGAAADPASGRRLHQAFAASTSTQIDRIPLLVCVVNSSKRLTTYNSVCNVLSGPSNAWSLMGPLSSEGPNASCPPRERKGRAPVEVDHSGRLSVP